MSRDKISYAVVRRLPRYLRYLDELCAKGVMRISSKTLASLLGLTASQIRQDLNCFGGFGQQGYGYNVKKLRDEIAGIIGVENSYTAIIIGAGNIGRALINNFSFPKRGFALLAAFDKNPELLGTLKGIKIMDISELDGFIERYKPDVAVLALPRAEAHNMAERLANAGVRGLWNFTNIDLQMEGRDVKVENVHFSDSLLTLCYRISEEGDQGEQ